MIEWRMPALRPGDIMFGSIGGIVPGLFPVGVGQLLLKAATRETFHIRHVGVVTSSAVTNEYGGINVFPHIVQAMPSGAEEIEIGLEHFTEHHVYLRPPYAVKAGTWGVTVPEQGLAVARAARRYVGTPYSFLDYLSLAGLHLGVKNGYVRQYVRDSGHMICSQLADQAMSDAGFHVFDDGRLPQDVMPAELYRKLLSMSGTEVIGS